jgi:hypothetical protein
MRTMIEMAREAGDDWDSTLSTDKEFLKRFADLVRADERKQGQKWFDAVTAQHKQLILATTALGTTRPGTRSASTEAR